MVCVTDVRYPELGEDAGVEGEEGLLSGVETLRQSGQSQRQAGVVPEHSECRLQRHFLSNLCNQHLISHLLCIFVFGWAKTEFENLDFFTSLTSRTLRRLMEKFTLRGRGLEGGR